MQMFAHVCNSHSVKKGLAQQLDIFFNDVKNILENKCKNRENPRKCVKYFRTLIEKGKDVEKIFQFQKLKRDHCKSRRCKKRQQKKNLTNGELGKVKGNF